MLIKLYSVTPAKAEVLRASLAFWGADKARVRQMPNGSCRIVLASPDHYAAARDSLVECNACTASGQPFSHPDNRPGRFSDHDPTQLFVRFLEP